MKSTTMVIYGENRNIIGLLCIIINVDRPFSEMMNDIIQATIKEVDSSPVSHANRNKQIIGLLHGRGIFQMRDAAAIVAKALKITKHTVYLHLRNLQAKDEK